MRLHRFWIADFGLRIAGERPQAVILNPQLVSLLFWSFAGSVAAVVVGWLAAKVHASGHAPLGLTSLGVGAFLGATLSFLAAHQQRSDVRLLVVSAVFFAILTIAAEHAWLYLDFRGQWREARTKSAAVAMFRPEEPPTPREYFARDWNPQLWFADAAIITATTAAVTLIARRYAKTPDP